jgi:hypothetical protein
MMTTDGALSFGPVAGRTLMHWSWEVRPRGLLRLMSPLVSRLGRRQELEIWGNLKRLLERGEWLDRTPAPASREPRVAVSSGAAAHRMSGFTHQRSSESALRSALRSMLLRSGVRSTCRTSRFAPHRRAPGPVMSCPSDIPFASGEELGRSPIGAEPRPQSIGGLPRAYWVEPVVTPRIWAALAHAVGLPT